MKLPHQIVRDFAAAQDNFLELQGLFPLASALIADRAVTYPKIGNAFEEVVALPGSPIDGQIVRYVAAAGVEWLLVYNADSVSPNKWECIGGAPLKHEVATDETRANVAYGDLATVGPTLTAPLAGEYDIVGAAEGFIGATGNSTLAAAVKLGAAATADAETVSWQGTVGSAGAGVQGSLGSRSLRRTLAVGDVVKIQYKASAGTGHWMNRALSLQPVRVS